MAAALSLWVKSDFTATEIYLHGNQEQRLEGIREFLECATATPIRLSDSLTMWVDEDGIPTQRTPNYAATFILFALGGRQPTPLRGPVMVTQAGNTLDSTLTASLKSADVAMLKGHVAAVRELAGDFAPGRCPACGTPEADNCAHKEG